MCQAGRLSVWSAYSLSCPRSFITSLVTLEVEVEQKAGSCEVGEGGCRQIDFMENPNASLSKA
jgi:hypothetical protein